MFLTFNIGSVELRGLPISVEAVSADASIRTLDPAVAGHEVALKFNRELSLLESQ